LSRIFVCRYGIELLTAFPCQPDTRLKHKFMVVHKWTIALPRLHHWPWPFCVIMFAMKFSSAAFCQLILRTLLFFDGAVWAMASPDLSSHQSRQNGTCSGITTWPPGLADYTSANTDGNLRQ
jgi:hypothetical protein